MTRNLLLAAAMVGVAAAASQAAILEHELGTLTEDTADRVPSDVSGTLTAGDLVYVTFNLPTDVAPGVASLDIETNDSSFDTEIALYSGFGPDATFIAEDDNDGTGNRSYLSFGEPGLRAPALGQDGSLTAGLYTLVLGGQNTVFTTDLGDVVAGSAGGSYLIDFDYDVIPEPATASLLAVGALAALRRRRA